MKKTVLSKICVTVLASACFLLQGCSDKKPVEWVDSSTSVSVSSEAQTEKNDTSEASVSKEDTSEASTVESAKAPEASDERQEGVFLRLVQQDSTNPVTIDFYEDGSCVYYDKDNADENFLCDWTYSEGSVAFARSGNELEVNELKLEEKGFSYVAYGSSGFAVGEVTDKAFFADTEKKITVEEFDEYQQNLGGAPFHARFPGRYAEYDDIFLGDWKDESGIFTVNIFKASAETGGYSFTIKDSLGNELGSGDAAISNGGLMMIQGEKALSGVDCSAVKSDTGITVTLDSAALSNYGIPAGDKYDIYLTR